MLQLPQQLDLPEKVRRSLKRQWDTLQDTVQQLRPIERFRVVGVAFRRCSSLIITNIAKCTEHIRENCTKDCSMLSLVDPSIRPAACILS